MTYFGGQAFPAWCNEILMKFSSMTLLPLLTAALVACGGGGTGTTVTPPTDTTPIAQKILNISVSSSSLMFAPDSGYVDGSGSVAVTSTTGQTGTLTIAVTQVPEGVTVDPISSVMFTGSATLSVKVHVSKMIDALSSVTLHLDLAGQGQDVKIPLLVSRVFQQTVPAPFAADVRPGPIAVAPDHTFWYAGNEGSLEFLENGPNGYTFKGRLYQISADHQVRTYVVALPYDLPITSIDPMADGSLWLAIGTRRVIHYHPATGMQEEFTPGGNANVGVTPSTVHTSDGRIWYHREGEQAFFEVGPAAGVVTEHKAMPASLLNFMKADMSGHVYWTQPILPGLLQYTPSTDTMRTFSTGIGDKSLPFSPVIMPDQTLYFQDLRKMTISHLDPSTAAIQDYDISALQVNKLATDREGNLWGDETSDVPSLALFDLTNKQVILLPTLPSTPGFPRGGGIDKMLFDLDGNLWYTQQNSAHLIEVPFGEMVKAKSLSLTTTAQALGWTHQSKIPFKVMPVHTQSR